MIDPDFPVLDELQRIDFPAPDESNADGIIASGGNLSPGMLLSAYSQGAFPWYSENEPILWWNPNPRCVLFPEKLHVSKRMERTLRSGRFVIRSDSSFKAVIKNCAGIKRRHEEGTWIDDDIISGYCQLHELGWAHSIEAWLPADELGSEIVEQRGGGGLHFADDGMALVGGLYGISLGHCFFGESMFSKVADASKAAFISMVRVLSRAEIEIIDCQMTTPHLTSLGAEEISRTQYMHKLNELKSYPDLRGQWRLF